MNLLLMVTDSCNNHFRNNEQVFHFVAEDQAARFANVPRVNLISICEINPFIVLLKSIRIWLKTHNIDYTLSATCEDSTEDKKKVSWYIDIPDNNKAMLFKLTWM